MAPLTAIRIPLARTTPLPTWCPLLFYSPVQVYGLLLCCWLKERGAEDAWFMAPDGLHPSCSRWAAPITDISRWAAPIVNILRPFRTVASNTSPERALYVRIGRSPMKKDNTFCLALKGRNIELPSGYSNKGKSWRLVNGQYVQFLH